MVYLSIQCSATALKESIETKGSGGDLKTCEELKSLLEEYTKTLGSSFSDAVEMITEISQDARTFEVSLFYSFHVHSCQLVLLFLTLGNISAELWFRSGGLVEFCGVLECLESEFRRALARVDLAI